MTIITEDYVSFETANLLKEKGFNEKTYRCYNLCTEEHELSDMDDIALNNWDLADDGVSAPTLQMAMKWLRRVHNLYITITHRFSHNSDNDVCFGFYINIDHGSDGEWLTYEEAAEAAIKYCLENLI